MNKNILNAFNIVHLICHASQSNDFIVHICTIYKMSCVLVMINENSQIELWANHYKIDSSTPVALVCDEFIIIIIIAFNSINCYVRCFCHFPWIVWKCTRNYKFWPIQPSQHWFSTQFWLDQMKLLKSLRRRSIFLLKTIQHNCPIFGNLIHSCISEKSIWKIVELKFVQHNHD